MRVAKGRQPYMLLMPVLILYGVFFIFPFFYSLSLSFTNWTFMDRTYTFIGLDNYRELLASRVFWVSFRNTLLYVLVMTPFSMALGLGYALLIEKTKILKPLYRFIFFIPVVVSVAASSLSFGLLYNRRNGLINAFLALAGIEGPNWLNNPTSALIAVMMLGLWNSFGFNVILYIAGIQQLDKELYEAADIDGTSTWTKLTRITLPLLSPVTFFVFVMTTLFSFRVFDTVQILTMGGPQHSTSVLVFYVWQEAFRFFNTGVASSAATILFFMMLVLTLFMVRIVQKKVHYQ